MASPWDGTRLRNSTHRDSSFELRTQIPWNPELLLQPDSRPISQEQLACEVKSIYTGLTMVEAKCIHIDRSQAPISAVSQHMTPHHWQALLSLHLSLLHEHHDFFLASQHPFASQGFRRLASKYAMPVRVWKHGIHNYLELMRKGLPNSFDHMLAFIYLAYQMVATLPSTEDTWIECLGDLGAYRMAIEEDTQDRETWAGVARAWCSKAAERTASLARLYHHLAIVSQPNAIKQLHYESRFLTAAISSSTARESILTLLDSVLLCQDYGPSSPIDANFVQAHALLFGHDSLNDYITAAPDFHSQAENFMKPLPEDYVIKGLIWTESYFPQSWFDADADANDLRYLEPLQNFDGNQWNSFDRLHQNQMVSKNAFRQSCVRSRWLNLNSLRSTINSINAAVRALVSKSLLSTATSSTRWASMIPRHAGALLAMAHMPLTHAAATSADAPVPMQETPFDWTMTGLMIIYMAFASFASRRLRRTSLILMFMLGTLHLPATDEKSLEGIRETILKGWFASASHYVFQDCYNAKDTTLHAVLYGILTALFATIGATLPRSSLTKALPLSVALAAGVLALLFREPEHSKQDDPEQGYVGTNTNT